MPFGGLVVATPHLWGEIPAQKNNSHFGGINKLSTFKPNVQNDATCILSKLLHQDVDDIALVLQQNRLRWYGHVAKR